MIDKSLDNTLMFDSLSCLEQNKINLFRWSLRESVARRASSNIWGKGFTFQGKTLLCEEAFKKLNSENNLLNLFSVAERNCSMYGRAVLTINQTKEGNIYLNLCNPFYFQGIGKVFATPQLGVVYQKVTVSNANYILKTTYTTTYVKNEIFTQFNDTISIFDGQADILKSLQMKNYWKHNLGFVPLVEITNLPFFQYEWNNWEYTRITDWYPAFEWERVAYIAVKNFKKELTLNHSRILLENSDQNQIQKYRLDELADTEVDIGDLIIETEVGAQAKIQPTNTDFYNYTSSINYILDFYFKLCGSSKFSEGGGAQKTVAETATIRSQMIENLQQKISLREAQYSRLIYMLLKACGLKDKDLEFDFSINGNIFKDDNSYIDQLIKKYEIGAISIIDIIQDIFGLNTIQAKEKFKQIQEFNKKNGIKTSIDNFLLLDEADDAKINEAGEHLDKPDKRGEA